jgi:hypothetical protein
LLVGGLSRLGDPARKGPVYVTTTSAGPRGSFEQRPLNQREQASGGTTTEPGFALLEMANDGTVKGIRFAGGTPPAEQQPAQRAPQREVAFAGW